MNAIDESKLPYLLNPTSDLRDIRLTCIEPSRILTLEGPIAQ